MAKKRNLRPHAKGQDCQVREPGVCNFNPETTVLALEAATAAPPTWTRVEDSDGPFIIGEQYMINTKSRGVVLANAVLDEHAIMVSGEDIENEHDITDVTHFVGPITPPEGES